MSGPRSSLWADHPFQHTDDEVLDRFAFEFALAIELEVKWRAFAPPEFKPKADLARRRGFVLATAPRVAYWLGRAAILLEEDRMHRNLRRKSA